ncbi:MAG: ABC transporter substrate-binding protein [Clostridia bacterium]|nr:ABC transporter substrate-binding protein [Clostridia bacterium]
MKKIVTLLLALLIALSAGAGLAVDEGVTGKVVIYTSMYQDVIDLMDAALEAEFPNCDVEFFYGGTGTLQTKLAGEMETGVLGCDMMLVAEPAYSIELKEGGWLHPYILDRAQDLRFEYDEEGYWYPIRVCAMGLAYNPDMYDIADIPRTFYDFAYDTSAAGMISMSNPLTSGTAMATIVGLLDKYGEEYFDALGNQDVMIESGSSALAKLETGECSVIMILEESVLKKREEEGSTLEWFCPEDGDVLIPSTVMTVAADRSANNNIAACEKITEWLMSDEGQGYIVSGWMHSVITDFPKEPYDGMNSVELIEKDIGVDWVKCYTERESIRTMFQEKVTVG